MNTLYYTIIIIAILLILLIFVAFSLKRNKTQNEEPEVETELERKARQAMESELSKGKVMLMALIITGIAGMLGKLWDWWFTPKKVAVTAGLLFLTGGVFSFLVMTTVSGEFAVNVRSAVDIIPPENLELITLSIEAVEPLDSAGNYKPLTDIKYTRIDVEEPQEKATVPTNKDGIAYIKYKGRDFDPDKINFKVKIIATTSDFETKYYLDSFFIKAADYDNSLPVINLRKKREMVEGSMPFAADIKNALKGMKATENPSNKFALRIYPKTAEKKNEQIGIFSLIKSTDEPTGEDFEWDGSAYIIKDLEFATNYLIKYNIFDSSEIKLEIIPDDPRIDVKVNDGKPLTVAKKAGGNLPLPKAADNYVPPQSQGVQYQIMLNMEYLSNIQSQPFNSIEYSIKSSNSEFTDNVTSVVPDNGVIIYPSSPIEDINRFWEVAGNLSLQLKFRNSEFKFEIEELKRDSIVKIVKSEKIGNKNNKSKVLVINKDNFNTNNELKIIIGLIS